MRTTLADLSMLVNDAVYSLEQAAQAANELSGGEGQWQVMSEFAQFLEAAAKSLIIPDEIRRAMDDYDLSEYQGECLADAASY